MADEDVIALGTVTRLALKYVENVAAVVCLIVPPSFVTIPSPAATAVVPALVSPSTIFSSVAVDVTAVPPILGLAKSKLDVMSATAAPEPAPSAYINFPVPATTETLPPEP